MLTVFGSVALDTIRTKKRTVRGALGGAASFAAVSSSRFCRTGLVGVVGSDFPSRYRRLLASRADLAGLEEKKGRTFRYDGAYDADLTSRRELSTKAGRAGRVLAGPARRVQALQIRVPRKQRSRPERAAARAVRPGAVLGVRHHIVLDIAQEKVGHTHDVKDRRGRHKRRGGAHADRRAQPAAVRPGDAQVGRRPDSPKKRPSTARCCFTAARRIRYRACRSNGFWIRPARATRLPAP